MNLTKQSLEEHMRRLFDEKIEMEQQRLARITPFREKFFTADCNWGTRPGLLEQLQSEKVQSIDISDSTAAVITTQTAFYVHSGATFEMRYLLRTEDERWLIYEVDIRCCCGDGQSSKTDCPCCHGTGWRNTNAQKSSAT
jgi:hypothetical protein